MTRAWMGLGVAAALAAACECEAQHTQPDCIELYGLPLKTQTLVLTGKGPAGARYSVRIDGKPVTQADEDYDEGRGEFAIRLPEPLVVDQKVQLQANAPSGCGTPVLVVQASKLDARHNTDIGLFAGGAFETASGSQGAKGATNAAFEVGVGIDFRVAGTLEEATRRKYAAWVSIFRVGVQAAYGQFLQVQGDPASLGVLKDASVAVAPLDGLSVTVAPRYELLSLRAKPGHLIAYAKASLTLLVLPKSGRDVEGLGFLGIGATSTTGAFTDSFVEVGVGRNPLFQGDVFPRLVVNAALFAKIRPAWRFYARLGHDNSLGPSSDSFRVQAGLQFDIQPLERP